MSTVVVEAVSTSRLPALSESNRGAIEGLPSRMPIGPSLPGLYQEDEFCQRLTTVFDEALTPVVTTLDCEDSYLHPALAPDDFLEWLAGWVAVSLDNAWSPDQRRRLVAEAVGLYRSRGTVACMEATLELYTGYRPEILESGACDWSSTADSALPGTAQPFLTVRVSVPAEAHVDRRVIEGIVAENKPAHIPHSVEIIEVETPRPARAPRRRAK